MRELRPNFSYTPGILWNAFLTRKIVFMKINLLILFFLPLFFLSCKNKTETAQVVPDSEWWLHSPEGEASLDRALSWAEANPPRESDLKALRRKVLRSK